MINPPPRWQNGGWLRHGLMSSISRNQTTSRKPIRIPRMVAGIPNSGQPEEPDFLSVWCHSLKKKVDSFRHLLSFFFCSLFIYFFFEKCIDSSFFVSFCFFFNYFLKVTRGDPPYRIRGIIKKQISSGRAIDIGFSSSNHIDI